MTTALILGRGDDVFKEAEAAHKLAKIDFTIATGPIAVDYRDVDYWLWFHAELFPEFSVRRANKGHPPVKEYWSVPYKGRGRQAPGIPVKYFEWPHGGSSGLVAVGLALLEKEADRVMLAGIPMTAEGGRYDDKKPWTEAAAHRIGWDRTLNITQGKVKSFSGWTKELLGEPTAEWLGLNVAA